MAYFYMLTAVFLQSIFFSDMFILIHAKPYCWAQIIWQWLIFQACWNFTDVLVMLYTKINPKKDYTN